MKPDESQSVPRTRGYESTDKFTSCLDDYADGGRQKMPRKSPFQRCLGGYVQYLSDELSLAEDSVGDYETAIKHCRDIVQGAGGPENPMKVSKENLRHLVDDQQWAPATGKYYWSIYSGFLKWCGNLAVYSIKPKWPIVDRINVDWLEPEQAYKVRETAMEMSPLIGLIVHLELDLLLRRVEVLRLRTRDIHKSHLDVLGKGRNGGKWRTVSLDAVESAEIIGRWMQVRSQMLAQTSGPQTDACMVYLKGGSIVPYKPTAVDDMLESVMKESGVHFKGNHTLRRTGGRLMWKQDVPIETIASIMGHEDIKTTLRYLGINLGDQAKAVEAVRNARLQITKVAQNVPFVTVPGV